ncbi:response regulator, partial [Caenispirillum bisanense]|uniref:response regulator n=1 Tax=Caenispirillum bisanense TaxID=414052 RepID=UPI0031D3E3A7
GVVGGVDRGPPADLPPPRAPALLPAEAAEAPSAAAAPAAPAAPPGAADLAGGGTVLLVEDEDAVRVFATRALRNKGYTVLEARTGEGALDILRDTPDIDLLITDMVMPGMDGATLARLVRVERPEIRVILISGYSEEVARGDLVDSKDIHFLPKPFDLAQLAARVKEVMAAEH